MRRACFMWGFKLRLYLLCWKKMSSQCVQLSFCIYCLREARGAGGVTAVKPQALIPLGTFTYHCVHYVRGLQMHSTLYFTIQKILLKIFQIWCWGGGEKDYAIREQSVGTGHPETPASHRYSHNNISCLTALWPDFC